MFAEGKRGMFAEGKRGMFAEGKRGMLMYGENIDDYNNDGMTKLHMAAAAGDLEAVKHLIAAGADVNTPDDVNAWLPIHFATEQESLECVRELLKQGSFLNAKSYDDKSSPLHIACETRNIDIARVLLEAGADPNAQRSGTSSFEESDDETTEATDAWAGATCLHIVATTTLLDGFPGTLPETTAASIEIVKLLLAHGADPEIKDAFGETPREDCKNLDIYNLLTS
jgi:ankyrin repeat protein